MNESMEENREEVDVGIDIDGDRKPDIWLKLKGKKGYIITFFIGVAVGIGSVLGFIGLT